MLLLLMIMLLLMLLLWMVFSLAINVECVGWWRCSKARWQAGRQAGRQAGSATTTQRTVVVMWLLLMLPRR